MRSIDVSGYDRHATPKSELPVLEWIAVENLRINEAYQRPIEGVGKRNIKNIAQNFQWTRFSPLLVARLDGGLFAVIDGQHRAHAAAIRGIEKVPAMIAEMSDQEQAAAFSWVNGSVTQLTAVQVYRAALAAFEPWAVQCEAAVTKSNCRLMTFTRSAAQKQPGEIFCVKQIRQFVDQSETQALVTALTGLRASANGQEDTFWYNASPIRCLTYAVMSTGTTRHEVVTEFCDHVDLWTINDRVNKLLLQPEFRKKNYRGLFQESLTALFNQYLREAA